MSLIVNRKNNRTPNNNNASLFSDPLVGGSVELKYSGDSAPNHAINLAGARLRIQMTFKNALNPVTLITPAISWIQSYYTTIVYKTGNGPHDRVTVKYDGMPGRGDAGFVFSLMTRSAANTAMRNFPEVINSRTVTGTSTEESIPLMFLLDPAATDRWLPIEQISITLNFKSRNQIMFAPSSPNFDPVVVNYWLEYDTGYYGPGMIKELMLPDPRRTTMYVQTVPAPTLSLNPINISVSGRPLCVFYWFMVNTASTGTTPPVYNMNPNPYSVTTYHQINIGGHTFPLNGTYQAIYDAAGNNAGTSSHYDEFLQNVNKYMPDYNTSITYDDWLANHRIYSVLINDVDVYNTVSLPLQITLSQDTTVECRIMVAVVYVPVNR